jgi:predicted nuclease of restriction endonuclease-like (RecB) superfamily
MLFDRGACPESPEKLARKELDALRSDGEGMPDMVFRAPCILDFPNFSGRYREWDLETAVLRDMEALLLKMSRGSSFVGRQKRMVIDGPDHTLGLFSYHRRLRRLVAVELILGRSKSRAQGTDGALPRRAGREGTGIQ